MPPWLMNRLAQALRRRLSDQRLDEAFARLPEYSIPPKEPGKPVRVCALQAEIKTYAKLPHFVAAIDEYCVGAVRQGAQLVCFPELFGLLLFGLLPAVRLALWLAGKLPKASKAEPSPPASQEATISLPALLAPFDFLQERYTALMARFARRYGLHVACGTLFVPEGGKVYNRHVLLGPSGEALGQADKLHLTTEERLLGLSAGERVCVVPTEIGNIALTVCMDATYFETFRIAKGLGADYAIVPIGDMAEFNPWLALRGAQPRASETGLPIVKPALVSSPGFPVCFTGRAGIWFPLESACLSVEAERWDAPAWVTVELDLAALRTEGSLFCRGNAAFDARFAAALQEYDGATRIP